MRLPLSIVRAMLATPIASACAALVAGPAFAQVAPRASLQDASARAFAAARAEAAALADKARRAGAIDETPPVLHAIEVKGRVDAQGPDPHADAFIDMTDDLSGIVKLALDIRSPSGVQHVVTFVEPGMPARRFLGSMTIGSLPFTDTPLTAFAEPGKWEAMLLYAYDANGNFAGYSQNQLRALGTTTFMVRNDRYDIVAPSLAGGTIETPRVRLSKPPKGMPSGTLPYAGASVRLTDDGNGAISGVASARIIFCADGCAHSFVMAGRATQTGLASAKLVAGTQLGEGQHPGVYEIFAMTLDDVAGNEGTLTSTAFGGDTDFGDFFPDGATVTVVE